jgi:hypothetical protein
MFRPQKRAVTDGLTNRGSRSFEQCGFTSRSVF